MGTLAGWSPGSVYTSMPQISRINDQSLVARVLWVASDRKALLTNLRENKAGKDFIDS